ncbi:unnamed protein product [Thlaspi arvense]|uniref:F-box domain-containing protein n=1 Tax=Thlaspi arvense TaxID=13288 RepID=A0AAU9SB43_THLAR|nr:unnamed protein product [Thlaspi arvense]
MISTASNSEEPSLSLSSLPDDVVLNCLARVPRCYDLNLSCVSKALRSLVRSPDLYRLRSKKSVYLYWTTLRRSEKTSDYQLVPVPLPSDASMFLASSTVAVGSKIYFFGRLGCPSKSLLIPNPNREGAPSIEVETGNEAESGGSGGAGGWGGSRGGANSSRFGGETIGGGFGGGGRSNGVTQNRTTTIETKGEKKRMEKEESSHRSTILQFFSLLVKATMSTPSASNADEPPQEDKHQPSSISSLPEELILRCLACAPRNCYLNLSRVSKTLRCLVRSPELHRLRSLLPKNSTYVCFKEYKGTKYRWLTLRRVEKTTTIKYRLIPAGFPSRHPFRHASSAVAVGSDIYFFGASFEPSSDVWIINTRSGKFRKGPNMKVARRADETVVGVIDGKIYVITALGCEEESQVEVLDTESKIWKFAGKEKVPPIPWCKQYMASLERKVYMVECGRIRVYNPREEDGRNRMVHMVSEKRESVSETRERVSEDVDGVCGVENVLYACFDRSGLMWFDTKLNVWKRLVCREGDHELVGSRCLPYGRSTDQLAMAEYEGKLAVFQSVVSVKAESEIYMSLFALDRVGERLFGTIEWSGAVANIPHRYTVVHCLVASAAQI